MGKKTRAVILVFAAIAAAHAAWSRTGRDPAGIPRTGLKLLGSASFGADRGRGNLVGIQPYMETWDYASEARFHAKMESYFSEASRQGWFNPGTVVTLPEYLGAWLVVADERNAVYEASTTDAGIGRMVLARLPRFLPELIRALGTRDPLTAAVFKMKAPTVARIYHGTFSALARKHRVTIVAGSVVLPPLAVTPAGLELRDGPLYNMTLVYRPDGSADPRPTRKVFVVKEEYGFTAPGAMEELPVYETPAGRMAVLICADAWYKSAYDALKARGVDLVVVPSYIHHDGFSDHAWSGPNLIPDHEDYDRADAGRITGNEAWIKYTLPSKIRHSGAKHGMISFLRGKFWDLGSDGQLMLVRDGQLLRGPGGVGASLVNSWL